MPNAGIKRKQAGFIVGHGYHSVWSGNYWTFLGMCQNKLFHFYRRFSGDWERLTRKEALLLFDIGSGGKDSKFGDAGENKLNLNDYTKGGRI